MHRKPLAAGAVALALLLAGCQDGGRAAAPLAQATTEPTAAATTAPPATAEPTAVPTTASPSPTASPRPAPPSYDVRAVQRRLTELKYYVGPVDGERGAAFRSAVMAFQKVNGLAADGSVGKVTLAALKTPKAPVLREHGAGTRVEVDLTKQVLYLVRGDAVVRILPVSSGSGKHYLTKSGARATALSPVGHYVVQRRIVGERHADLGTLYDPQYFYKGWAIHGSNSVPAYPASHGCIRVTRWDAKYLLREIGVGTAVFVYGGTFTFPAGSSAPGTDDPGGDTGDTAAPSPTPTASAKPSPKPSPKPSASPSPSGAPSPSPSASPTPTSPVPTP